MSASRKRSLVKTLTWRVLATADTFVIAYLITGEFTVATSIAGLEVMTKMVLYYLHERGWSSFEWGQDEITD
ncbi:MAG: hypothetical protein CMA68_00245 [Euryarchaeota archaeon]|nr:hypothetical protein [Euryarchaeota archaeon]|tara:strand:- start:643 stop:858 length:216 start_codon:yes stop_codon:yes gene_type:complete